MSLKTPEPTEDVIAAQIANQLVTNLIQFTQRLKSTIDNGVPAQTSQDEQTLPDGRKLPPRPAISAVSSNKIQEALGLENLKIISEACKIILGE